MSLKHSSSNAAYRAESGEVQLDLNEDGVMEIVQHEGGRLQVRQGSAIIWESPSEWNVMEYASGDLNDDEAMEMAVLVRRQAADIPINSYIAEPWEHPAYRYPDGDTCHLVLIGNDGRGITELWAGSGLVRPMTGILVDDLDHDGRYELVGIEENIDETVSGQDAISIWQWEGFNFTLLDRREFRYFQAASISEVPDQAVLLVSGWEED